MGFLGKRSSMSPPAAVQSRPHRPLRLPRRFRSVKHPRPKRLRGRPSLSPTVDGCDLPPPPVACVRALGPTPRRPLAFCFVDSSFW